MSCLIHGQNCTCPPRERDQHQGVPTGEDHCPVCDIVRRRHYGTGFDRLPSDGPWTDCRGFSAPQAIQRPVTISAGVDLGHDNGMAYVVRRATNELACDRRTLDALHLAFMVQDELGDGGCWHFKAGGKIDMSFSLTLLHEAGGIRRLLTEWEPERGSPLWKKWGLR